VFGFHDLNGKQNHIWYQNEEARNREEMREKACKGEGVESREGTSKKIRKFGLVPYREFMTRTKGVKDIGSISVYQVLKEAVSGKGPKVVMEDWGFSRLLKRFESRFAEPKSLPPKRPEDLEIKTTSSEVPRQRGIGKLNQEELEQLRKQLKEMLLRGHIQPSTSPYASSILFVRKADGKLRMCIDFRGLNQITVKNRCPIPNIDELRERLAGATVFSKIDLREGFYNLRVQPQDCHKTAFKCRYGLYEFRVVPMGLSNSPAAFQAMMNRIFGDLLDVCVIIYLDDVVIFSKSPHSIT
jgi:Reverse transcriptase (RNA-dependent DNA polymerase)